MQRPQRCGGMCLEILSELGTGAGEQVHVGRAQPVGRVSLTMLLEAPPHEPVEDWPGRPAPVSARLIARRTSDGAWYNAVGQTVRAREPAPLQTLNQRTHEVCSKV